MTPRLARSLRRLRRDAAVTLGALCVAATRASAQTGPSSPTPAQAGRPHAPVAAPPLALPEWAFPHGSGGPATPPVDGATPHRVAHSHATFTEAEVRDLFAVPDWRPALHPPMPDVVAHGRRPAVFACGYCHLADGIGRPENAMLAGLPAAYLAQQMADLRSGARRSAWAPYGPGATMQRIADSATASEVAAAAAYFAGLQARRRSRVVEATHIPRAVAASGLYFRDPRGGVELLGDRLVEVAQDRAAHEVHDPRTAYVAYVPPGSVQRGRVLSLRGRSGGTTSCASCHGAALRGAGLVPPLAGRSPSYLLRQLLAFRTGTRSSAAGAPMRAEAATLDVDDMIAAAAYAGSLRP